MTYTTARTAFLRGLAVVYAVAVISLWVQVDGLVGPMGLLPVGDMFSGEASWLGAPTLLWLWPSIQMMHLLCGIGLVAAMLLFAGIAEGWMLAVMWVAYLSLSYGGQLFLRFQWDTLLVETVFAAMLIARWDLRGGRSEPSMAGLFVLRLLLFRLMFFGGAVKLWSGDEVWRDLTALTYHYWTQPLPNPVSWYVHQLPLWFHQGSVAATFVLELILPFGIFVPNVWVRRVTFAGLVVMMGVLLVSGNYGFFQLLAIVLCLLLLDDELFGTTAAESRSVWTMIPAAPLVLLAGLQMWRQAGDHVLPPISDSAKEVIIAAAPFRTVNGYGLFANMTETRPEVRIEVLGPDGWVPWPTRYKPEDVDVMPPQIAPHMPRLEWQLWFAALDPRIGPDRNWVGCRRNAWIMTLLDGLVHRREPVVALMGPDPVDGRIEAARAVVWDYRFGTDTWWEAERGGLYCPPVSR